MFTTEDIGELFNRVANENDDRFLFTPKWDSRFNNYRYALTFLAPERRFILSRMKIEHFTTVEDEALLSAFRGTLSEEDIAACMRRAITEKQEDDIPF